MDKLKWSTKLRNLDVIIAESIKLELGACSAERKAVHPARLGCELRIRSRVGTGPFQLRLQVHALDKASGVQERENLKAHPGRAEVTWARMHAQRRGTEWPGPKSAQPCSPPRRRTLLPARTRSRCPSPVEALLASAPAPCVLAHLRKRGPVTSSAACASCAQYLVSKSPKDHRRSSDSHNCSPPRGPRPAEERSRVEPRGQDAAWRHRKCSRRCNHPKDLPCMSALQSTGLP